MTRPNVAPRPTCRYYGTPRGCFAGPRCRYLHTDPTYTPVRLPILLCGTTKWCGSTSRTRHVASSRVGSASAATNVGLRMKGRSVRRTERTMRRRTRAGYVLRRDRRCMGCSVSVFGSTHVMVAANVLKGGCSHAFCLSVRAIVSPLLFSDSRHSAFGSGAIPKGRAAICRSLRRTKRVRCVGI